MRGPGLQLVGACQNFGQLARQRRVLVTARDRGERRGQVPAERHLPRGLLVGEQTVGQLAGTRARLLVYDVANHSERQTPVVLERALEIFPPRRGEPRGGLGDARRKPALGK